MEDLCVGKVSNRNGYGLPIGSSLDFFMGDRRITGESVVMLIVLTVGDLFQLS